MESGLNFHKIFELNEDRTSSRIERDHLFINPPLAKKNFLSNTIFCEGVKHWNNLSLEIRTENTLQKLISALNQINLDNI